MPFADELIGDDTAQRLIRAVGVVVPEHRLGQLVVAATQLGPLSLRERADLLRDALLADLPDEYTDLARSVRKIHEHAPDFDGWLIWPVTSAVAAKAVDAGSDSAFDDAMDLLAELTPLLTAEFSVRTLLRHDFDRALGIVETWTRSTDAHVRRLASEGTRPYLPWSIQVSAITARPGVTVPILDALYRDDSEYVRRSVANHLNDLGRDHGALVVATAQRWLADPDENTEWVVRPGLRTLVKRGDAGALALLGFPPATVDIDGPWLDRTSVAFPGSVRFGATIRNVGDRDARLAIDYVVHHRKANGSDSSKTFKWTVRTVPPGEAIEIEREHVFRPITTRRYYSGAHAVSLQINGTSSTRAVFDLRVPD